VDHVQNPKLASIVSLIGWMFKEIKNADKLIDQSEIFLDPFIDNNHPIEKQQSNDVYGHGLP